MKAKAKAGALGALALAILMLAGCGPAPVEAASGQPIQVTDMMGRQIALDAPAERVVALAPSDCEILYALGAGDALVGRGMYCDYPAQVQAVPQVGTGEDTNLEQILALEPQVVFMTIMAQSKEQVAALEQAGIQVVSLNAQDIQGVYAAIDLIGQVMGKTPEADALIQAMQAAFSDLSSQAAELGTGGTVYFETSPLEWGLWTGGKGTFLDEIAAMLGLENAFGDVEGWAQISQEQVLERDPDYIVTLGMEAADGSSPVEEILARKGWEGMKAVQGGRVLWLDSDALTRPGPRLVEGAQSLFAAVYGTAAPANP